MATGTLQLSGVGVKAAVRAWDTPQRLLAALVSTCVGAALFFLLVMSAVSQLGSAITTVAKDSYPSIIAAQHIRASLADMDANAANKMIAKPGDNIDAVKSYEDDRADVRKTSSMPRTTSPIRSNVSRSSISSRASRSMRS